MLRMAYPRIAAFKTVSQFRERLSVLGLDLPCDDLDVAQRPWHATPQAQRRRGLVGSQCTRRCAQWLAK